MDSGSYTTVGSIHSHLKFCIYTWKLVGSDIRVRVADGERYSVVLKGLMNLRIDNRELGTTEVLLVDAPNWLTLLIGEDLLQHKGLSVQARN